MTIPELENATMERATTLLAKSIKEQPDLLLEADSVMYAAKDRDALLEFKTQSASGGISKEEYRCKLADALVKLNSTSHNAGTLSQPIKMDQGGYRPLLKDRHNASDSTKALIGQIAKKQQRERTEARSKRAKLQAGAMTAASRPSVETKVSTPGPTPNPQQRIHNKGSSIS
jgi:Skp family chaperone for outer membrane proteins